MFSKSKILKYPCLLHLNKLLVKLAVNLHLRNFAFNKKPITSVLSKDLAFYSLILVASVAIIVGMNQIYPHSTGQFTTIDSDGKGYYAYLPAIFTDQNIQQLNANNAFTNELNGKNFIKYPVGVALLISPFYFIALLFSLIAGVAVHGYSLPFQIAVQVAALIYSIIGIWFSGRLMDFYSISLVHKRMTLLLLFFGTNLLYYTLFLGCLSHVYSFAAIAAFLYFTKSYFIHLDGRQLLWSSVALALVVLLRPFNLLVLMAIPFLAGSFDNLKLGLSTLFSQKRLVLFIPSIFIGVVFIQLLLWKVQTGHWIIWSYSNEGFYFNKPAIFEVLFGFRKGLFVYSPLLLLIIPGIWVLKKQSFCSAISITAFIAILVYTISSWWNWYYGDGFGHRAFIDYYALFALLIAFGLQALNSNALRILWLSFAGFTLMLNCIQSYQYETDILHHHNMNAKKYAFTFLKTDASYRNLLGGNRDIKPYSKGDAELVLEINNSFSGQKDGWQTGTIELIHFGEKSADSAVVFKNNEFGLSFTLDFTEKLSGCRKIWIEAELKRADIQPRSSMGTLLVIAKKGADGHDPYYYSFPINDIPTSNVELWDTFNYSFEAPCFNEKGETLTIYLWNKELGHFAIDDFALKFYRIE